MMRYHDMLKILASLALFLFFTELTKHNGKHDEVQIINHRDLSEVLTDITIRDAISAWDNDAESATIMYGHISDWDVSAVTDMSFLFVDMIHFNEDISLWDVSSVTTMRGMFQDNWSFNQNLNEWDVSKVTNMASLFQNAYKFNGDISGWDVSSVSGGVIHDGMESMFSGTCEFSGDISAWDVSNVKNMKSTFKDTWALNSDISGWNVSQVINMDSMFQNAYVFNADISGWDVSGVTGYLLNDSMGNMFQGASNFDQEISGWDVSNVKEMDRMFFAASNFDQDITQWDISSVTTMSNMFYAAASFDQALDWNLENVEDAHEIFAFSSGALVDMDQLTEDQLAGNNGSNDGVTNVNHNGHVGNDPLFIGFNGQAFKFHGRDEAWYGTLGTSNFQWNSQFSYFKNCPDESDMFITAISMMFFDEKPINSISIMVKDKNEMFPGCPSDDNACLGRGSLVLLLDGQEITTPGEYNMDNEGGRIVVHNTFGACSRKWYDYRDDTRVSRSLRLKSPLELLIDNRGEMLDHEECYEWMKDRSKFDDLFLQNGHWTTIHIETPLVSFHVEYRKSRDVDCMSHSLDAWITRVSPEFEAEQWNGIMGETRFPEFYPGSEQMITDRLQILKGKKDSDYEVHTMHGTKFAAQYMN